MTDEPAGTIVDTQVFDQDGVTVLAVAGELDIVGAPQLAEIAYCVAAQCFSALVIDLTEVVFLSSSGISVLVRTAETMPAGTTLVLVAAHPAVQRPIVLSGLDRVITTVPDRAAAVAAVTEYRSAPPQP